MTDPNPGQTLAPPKTGSGLHKTLSPPSSKLHNLVALNSPFPNKSQLKSAELDALKLHRSSPGRSSGWKCFQHVSLASEKQGLIWYCIEKHCIVFVTLVYGIVVYSAFLCSVMVRYTVSCCIVLNCLEISCNFVVLRCTLPYCCIILCHILLCSIIR